MFEEKNNSQVSLLGSTSASNVASSADMSPNSRENSPSLDNLNLISGKKKLACSNCRKRRKKCDFNFPCGGCVKFDLECNINVTDLRKKRYKNNYVEELESKLEYLEKRLLDLERSKSSTSSYALPQAPVITPSTRIPIDRVLVTNESKNDRTNVIRNMGLLSSGQDVSYPNIYSLPPIKNYHPQISSFKVNGVNKIGALTAQQQIKHENIRSGDAILFDTGMINFPRIPPLEGKPAIQNNNNITQTPIKNNSGTNSNFFPGVPGSPKSVSNGLPHISHLPNNAPSPINLSTDPHILKSLKNFYKWLYPGYFVFLHRETFLVAFFKDYQDEYEYSRYCSIDLIYAVSAIGSRLSPELKSRSSEYFEKARLIVLNKVFRENYIAEITTVQTLLCLCFYELGNGNFSSAWYFSGLAIRIGYDIGFQLDPQAWVVDPNSKLTLATSISTKSNSNLETSEPADSAVNSESKQNSSCENDTLTRSEIAIRSRIYWGCYVADHYICLILGRTPSLSVSNSTIPDSDEMPEVTGTEDFKFESKITLQVSIPLKNLIILSRIVQIFTSQLFIEPNTSKNQKLEYLKKFNLKVYHWRESLPDFLKWSQKSIGNSEFSTDPTISYFWYHYYIVLLTLNKPFIGESEDSEIAVKEVLNDLRALFSRFKKMGKNTLNNCSLHQLFSCLLAIQTLVKLKNIEINKLEELQINNDDRNGQTQNKIRQSINEFEHNLTFFNGIFQSMSLTYDIPQKIFGGTLVVKRYKDNSYLSSSTNSMSHTNDSYISSPSPRGFGSEVNTASVPVAVNQEFTPALPHLVPMTAHGDYTGIKPFMTDGIQSNMSYDPNTPSPPPSFPPSLSHIPSNTTNLGTSINNDNNKNRQTMMDSHHQPVPAFIGMNVNNQYTNNVTDLNNMISYNALQNEDISTNDNIKEAVAASHVAGIRMNPTMKNNTEHSLPSSKINKIQKPFKNNVNKTCTTNQHDPLLSQKQNPLLPVAGIFTNNPVMPSASNGASLPMPPTQMPSINTTLTGNSNNNNNSVDNTSTHSQNNNNLLINNNNIEYTYDFSLSDEIDTIIKKTFGIDNFNSHHTL